MRILMSILMVLACVVAGCGGNELIDTWALRGKTGLNNVREHFIVLENAAREQIAMKRAAAFDQAFSDFAAIRDGKIVKVVMLPDGTEKQVPVEMSDQWLEDQKKLILLCLAASDKEGRDLTAVMTGIDRNVRQTELCFDQIRVLRKAIGGTEQEIRAQLMHLTGVVEDLVRAQQRSGK